jgi:hypothetical protein
MLDSHSWGRSLVAMVAALALVVGAAGCPRGSEAMVPKTRKGWGVAFIIVGGAWLVAGGATAADGDSDASVGQRAGLGLAFGAIGVGLIALGWTIGGFGRKAPPQPAQPLPPPQPHQGPPGAGG